MRKRNQQTKALRFCETPEWVVELLCEVTRLLEKDALVGVVYPFRRATTCL
jgi:hypothetical protein